MRGERGGIMGEERGGVMGGEGWCDGRRGVV